MVLKKENNNKQTKNTLYRNSWNIFCAQQNYYNLACNKHTKFYINPRNNNNKNHRRQHSQSHLSCITATPKCRYTNHNCWKTSETQWSLSPNCKVWKLPGNLPRWRLLFSSSSSSSSVVKLLAAKLAHVCLFFNVFLCKSINSPSYCTREFFLSNWKNSIPTNYSLWSHQVIFFLFLFSFLFSFVLFVVLFLYIFFSFPAPPKDEVTNTLPLENAARATYTSLWQAL